MVGLFSACSPSKEVNVNGKSKTKKLAKTELSEKEELNFKAFFHNALTAKLLGNYPEAVTLFRKCTTINPNEPAPYYELAHILENSSEKQLAIEFAKKAVDLDPKNYWYRIQYANSLQKQNKLEEAITQYKIIIKEKGASADLNFNLGGLQLYTGKYKEAIATFNLVEKEIGITEEISIQKEKIYVKLGDVDNAAKEIEALINEYPSNLKYQVLLADLYLANELADKAFSVYQEIIKKDPDNPYANISLYEYYKSKNDTEKAAEALRKTFASTELDINTKIKILSSYFSNNEKNAKKEALELSKILIVAHPNNAEPYAIYADFLYQDKKLEGAKENYLKALEYDKSKLSIWTQLVFIESELQDNEGLKKTSKEALELFPNQPIFYFFYGSVHLQQKNYEEAKEYLSTGKDYAASNPPLLAQFYANLGDANNGLKQYEESDKAYESALKIDPKNIYVLNNYGYYLSLREENLSRAEELSALCNELEPGQSNYQDTYAWILYKQGKFIQAKEWLEKAIKNGGNKSTVILEHLGDTHAKLNNLTKAVEFWEKAKANNDGNGTEFLDQKITDKTLYE